MAATLFGIALSPLAHGQSEMPAPTPSPSPQPQLQIDEPRVESVPTSGMLGFERVRLPGGEHMGLAYGSVLFDIGDGWGFGPAVYGAASGRRGGFFVGGVEIERRWGLSRNWTLATGLFAGGGGGASTPVGSGLMLRPAVTVLYDVGPSLQAGLSASWVRFDGGQISSRQIGVTLAWRNSFEYISGPSGSPISIPTKSTGLGFDRMSVTATNYRFTDPTHRQIYLAGAQAERRSDINGFTWGMEAAAAAKGDAAGYMELLGSAQYSFAPISSMAPSWRVGARVAAGLAGGGTAPTGGGLIGKAALTTEISPLPGWTVGAEYGAVSAGSGPFKARQTRVWLGIDLEPGLDGRSTYAGHIVRTEWVAALQHHFSVERRDGRRESISTIGLELNRYIDNHFYVSGQVHSAFSGNAGAYSVGLVGAGVVTDVDAPWRAGAEMVIGAAGGGGVKTAGGAIAQGMLWSAWKPSTTSEWRLGVGAMRGLGVEARTHPVVELSWSRAFGMAGR